MRDNIAEVIVWQNGMVMAFDKQGKQIPDLQGPIEKVKPLLIAAGVKEVTSGNWRCKTSNGKVLL